MPQAGLVRRDDGTLQVALQRIENTHAAKPSAGDQDAIRLLGAGHSHLLVQRFDRLLDAHTLPIQLARWNVAPLSAGIITQMPRRPGPACAPVPKTRRHQAIVEPGRKYQKWTIYAAHLQRRRTVQSVAGHRHPSAEFPRQRFHDRFVPLWATQDAAGAVANHDRRQAHRCELPAAAQQVIFQLHPTAVVAPARPGRPSGYSRSMHRHIQRDDCPPLGLGHHFTADDEHADTGLPAPVVPLCHDLSRKRLFAELSISRLSAPVERSSRGYIQSTAASVLYLSLSWTPAWRNN